MPRLTGGAAASKAHGGVTKLAITEIVDKSGPRSTDDGFLDCASPR
jgi:hypothetical protein